MQQNPRKTRLILVVLATGMLVAGLRSPFAPPASHVTETARTLTTTDNTTLGRALLPVLPVAAPIVVTAPAVDSVELERVALARFAHAPLASVFRRRTGDSTLADRIARALVLEANRLRVSPSLLAGVLIIENPQLNKDTVSAYGARGLMQVMQFHAGEYGCESDDLFEVEANICHGARVFGHYFKRWPDVRVALLRYNGCVRSTNTPNCRRYPKKVMQKASEVRRILLHHAAGRPGAAESRLAAGTS